MKLAKQEFRNVGLEDLTDVARTILAQVPAQRIWVFTGEMGAGKTTFIKTLGSLLGVEDNMSSPTFSIVNEYRTENGEIIYHFDFFRIKNEGEAYDIGAEEYFYSGNYCFIEWPEKIPGLLSEQYVHVQLSLENDAFRTIAVSVHDGEEKNGI